MLKNRLEEVIAIASGDVYVSTSQKWVNFGSLWRHFPTQIMAPMDDTSSRKVHLMCFWCVNLVVLKCTHTSTTETTRVQTKILYAQYQVSYSTNHIYVFQGISSFC